MKRAGEMSVPELSDLLRESSPLLTPGGAGNGGGETPVHPRPPASVARERGAEPGRESEDGAALLDDVERFVRRFVVLGDQEAAALALWAAHTHALDAAEASPYIVLLSAERRCGKTRLVEALEPLVARPWRVVGASEAAVFRKLADEQPTLLLDEVDAIFSSASERTEPLRAILNAGNRRGAAVARCVGDGANLCVRDFEVFGAKLLAGIDTGRLPDTIRDRSILIRLRRRRQDEQVQRFFRRLVEPEAAALRDRLAAWTVAQLDVLRDARPDLPGELNDRLAEGWEPLLALADLAGGVWPGRARAAAVALAADADVEETSVGVRVLGKLAELLRDRLAVPTEEVLDALNTDEELPFGGWRDGRGLDARGLARLLRPYGIRPRTVRLADGRTAKGYGWNAAVEDALARYLGAPPPQEASQASHPSQSPLDPSHVTDAPSGERLEQAVVTDVTDVTDKSRGVGGAASDPSHDPSHLRHEPRRRPVAARAADGWPDPSPAEVERLARLARRTVAEHEAVERSSLPSLPAVAPLPGEEGYREYVNAACATGLVTERERFHLRLLHDLAWRERRPVASVDAAPADLLALLHEPLSEGDT